MRYLTTFYLKGHKIYLKSNLKVQENFCFYKVKYESKSIASGGLDAPRDEKHLAVTHAKVGLCKRSQQYFGILNLPVTSDGSVILITITFIPEPFRC